MTPMEIHALHHGLEALIDTGLAASLSEGWACAEEHAGRADLAPEPVQRLLNLLLHHGLVLARDGEFKAADSLAMYTRSPRSGNSGVWSHMANWLRTGTSLVRPTTDHRGETYGGSVVDDLAKMFAPAAERLGAAMASRNMVDAAIADIGSGSGVWGLAILDACGASMLAVDLPQVLPRTEARAQRLGASEKLSLLAGDYHEVEIPMVDIVVLANILHLEVAQQAQKLIERFAARVRPGGYIVIVDALAGNDPVREGPRAAYAIHLGMRIHGGYPHEESVLRQWLSGHCDKVEVEYLGDRLLGALIGRRKSQA